MKVKSTLPCSTLPCFLAALILSGSGFAIRADDGAAPTPKPSPGRRFQSADGAGPFANILTEEQRTSMARALKAQGEKTRELSAKIRDARREMFSAGLAGKFDEAAVRKQAATVAGLETEMMVLRVKAMSEVQPPLSPEQVEKIRNAAPAGPGQGARPLERFRQRNAPAPGRDENDLPPKS